VSYLDALEQRLQATRGLLHYRLTLSESQSLRLGLRDNALGSVYAPLVYSAGWQGSFLVQWEDGKLSRGNLDGASLANCDAILAAARSAGIDDPDGANFLGPQQYPSTPVFSPETAQLVEHGSDSLLAVMRLAQQLAQEYQVETLTGGVGASASTSWVRTSKGLNAQEESTRFSWGLSFDSLLSDGESTRSPQEPQAIAERLRRTLSYLAPLRQEVAAPSGEGKIPVLLHPDAAWSLVGHYLLGNLSGEAVYHQQSAFWRADFDQSALVLRPDLSLEIDPMIPMGSDSFNFTSEGVPAGPQSYVQHGRLVTPILDLKYACRLGRPPTTPPAGAEGTILSGPTVSYLDLLSTIGTALLVFSFLGLHTQDRTSGEYSLTAPNAVVISRSQLQGRAKVTLTGNFFQQLQSESFRLVTFPGHHFPGMWLEG